jgi:TRAP transporter TAXI family solute receptor
MEREQYQQIAVGVTAVGIVAAIASGRLPRWLRITLVTALAIIALAAGAIGYRYLTQPVTLTVAAASLDGEAPRLLQAIATRLASTGAPVRLKVLSKPTSSEVVQAFANGEANLAVVRADSGQLPTARTVVNVTNAVVLIVVPPGSTIEDMDDLKGKTIGVIGSEINKHVVAVLTKEYDLEKAKIHFKDVALSEASKAVQSKQVQALLVVMPITEKYLSLLRSMFPQNAKSPPKLVAIESAEAIANVAKAYESYDLPKGTLRGSPPVPDDDLTTLRVPFQLVANEKLGDDAISALTKAIMETRRDLIGEFPVLSQISAPSTDKDAFVPIHPGAAAYFDGDVKTIFDKYGDQFFYGSMLLGTLMSLLAGAWKYMTNDPEGPERQSPPVQFNSLASRVNEAGSEAELAAIERSIDEMVKHQLERSARGEIDPSESSALNLAIQRLEHLVRQRHVALTGQAKPAGTA